MSFFDDEVFHEMKRKMIQTLTRPSDPEPPKKIQIKIDSINQQELADFLTSNFVQCLFFNILGISSSFLNKNVEDWPMEESFCIAKNLISKMAVVNNIAERCQTNRRIQQNTY